MSFAFEQISSSVFCWFGRAAADVRGVLAGNGQNMRTIGGKVSGDYGGEVTVFHNLREISDGVVFLDGRVNWDRYPADHSPRFELHLIMFNYTIIEIGVYYLHHRND